MKKTIRLTESELINVIKRIISEQEENSNEKIVPDTDPIKFFQKNLSGYRIEDTRKQVGYTTFYNGKSPDTSSIVVNIYHPFNSDKPYFISVNKNGKETRISDTDTGGFGKKYFEKVLKFINLKF